MPRQPEISWIKPSRLLSIDNAALIKIGSNKNPKKKNKNIYTPKQFREIFWRSPWQFNKFFYKLYDKNKIVISMPK